MIHKLTDKYNALSPKVRASFWFLVCSVMQKGISVITTPIFTRLLSSSEYGQYQVFNSWLSIVTIFITLDLTAGVYLMGLVKFKEDECRFSSSLQGLTLCLCLLWTGIYYVAHPFWNKLLKLTTVQMLAMIVMIWATSAFKFWMVAERNNYRYRALVITTLIVSVLKPVVGVVFVINAEDKATARILGLAIVELVCYTGFFLLQIARGKSFFSRQYWTYAVLFNLPLIPHYLSGTVLASSDKIMIQRLVGVSEAGIYGLAYSLAGLMKMFTDALNKTMSPWLYQKIREERYDRIHKPVYVSIIIIAACNMLLIAIAPEIVFVFAPKEYSGAIYAIVPVCLSGLFTYMYLCFAPFEFYFEKRIWTTIGTFLCAFANIVLNIIFIPIFGYVAAGYTTLICYILYATIHYYCMQKVCREYLNNIRPYNLKILMCISICYIVLGLSFIPLYKHPIFRYALIIVLFSIIFMKRRFLFENTKDLFFKKRSRIE